MPRVKAAVSRSRKLVQVRYNNRDNVGITNDDDTSSEDEEQTQIKDLCSRLPQLDDNFHVHSKIGEGTFSTVYLGSLKQHDLLPDSEKRWFAIKHLVPTAHPARVEHELRCLRELGGKDNVINVELCLRNLDTVVFIMPYIPHRKFAELILTFTASTLREYMRALTSALRHVHARGIIHRDVKPSNFLYDPVSNRYQLIDFGLAQRIESLPPPQTARVSVQRAPLGDKLTNLPECDASGAERRPSAHEHAANGTENVIRDDVTWTQDVDEKLCDDKPMKRPREEDVVLPEAKRVAVEVTSEASRGRDLTNTPLTKCVVPPCGCWGRGAVCRAGGVGAGAGAGAGAGVGAGCAVRPPARAPRAGTQGFRPPEVLLKYTHQTTAVDMWALGVVLLSGACARYPVLRARDDAHALAELCALLGHAAVSRSAAATRRRLVVSRAAPGLCLRRLCARLRHVPHPHPHPPRACHACRPHACVCKDPNVDPTQFDPHGSVAGFPDSLFSLLYRLLDPDPHTRISAAEALEHPFFTQP